MTFTKILHNGFRGFAIFFSTIFAIKLFLYLIGITNKLNIEALDDYQSFIGFALFTLHIFTKKVLNNFSK